MSSGALCGLAVVRYPAVWCRKGGDSTSTSPPAAAERMTTAAGPGRPVVACFSASCVPMTASLGLAASVVYLVIARKMAGRSMLPYSPAPDWFAGCCADPPSEVSVTTSIGELLSIASMMPKLALEPMNSPCPITAAGLPVARP